MQGSVDTDELAHKLSELKVEIVEKLMLLLVEGAQVVFVVEEERSVAIGCLQGIPMAMTPVVVVADADVAHQALALGRFLRGDGECQRTIGIYYHATVAVGLLGIVVVCLYIGCAIALLQLGIVLYGGQIGR